MSHSRMMIFAAAALIISSAANAEVYRTTLDNLGPDWKATLRCIQSEHKTPLPVPERWRVRKASLSFYYTNSSNLLGDISSLMVRLNDQPVSQTRLSPENPGGIVSVDLPVRLLKPGYNYISFIATQHFTRSCENPCAPDLWTEVNLGEAELALEYDLIPIPLELSSAPEFIFDSKMLSGGRINIITADRGDEMLTVAGIVASGAARKFDYRKVSFTVSGDVSPGVDNILVGKKEEVEAFFRRKDLEPPVIDGPFIKVMPLPLPDGAITEDTDEDIPPYDNLRALVIISGMTAHQAGIAAETLASMTFPFPGDAQTTIKEFHLPEITPYSGKNMIVADKDIKFSALGLRTQTFRGLQSNPADINFRLPPDFLIRENQYARITLNFVYGAGLRPDSALNIILNGVHVLAINMGNADGETIEGYKVEIPTHLFRPGNNTLRLAPILTPQAKECDLIQPESLFLTIFDNSRLYFPPMPHFVELPNLELFMQNGFPFTRWPDGFESMVYITRDDPALVNAALNIIGIMTQKNGYPLLGLGITTTRPAAWEGELLVVGDIESIPEDMRGSAPLKLLAESHAMYTVEDNIGGAISPVKTRQVSGLGPRRGLLMEAQSPLKAGRVMVMATSVSADGVLALSEAMLEPGTQGRVKGDVTLVEFEEPQNRIFTQSVGEKFHVGRRGKVGYMDYFFYYFPLGYYQLLAGGLLSLTVVLYIFFRLQRAGRAHAAGEGGTGPAKRGLLARIFLKPRRREDDEDKDD